jgi:polysaccharide pyruvyl transferase WcaK-like protein
VTAARRAPRVVLIGPYGTENLGDEATLRAALLALRARLPDAEFLVCCADPEDTARRHGVPAVRSAPGPAPRRPARRSPPPAKAPAAPAAPRSPWRRMARALPGARALRSLARGAAALASQLAFTARCFRQLRGASLVIVAGSGVCSDHFGGPFNFPLTIRRWTFLGRLRGAKVAFASVGVGPVRARLSRRLLRAALASADHRSYRDEASRSIAESLGAPRGDRVFPDLAKGLPAGGEGPRADRRPVVGVNPYPQADERYDPAADATVYRRYVAEIAAFVARLRSEGYPVFLFPTQLRADLRTIDDVLALLPPEARGDLVVEPRDVDDLLATLRRADLVVASRFHGIVLSLLLGRPVLGLSNHHKMAEAMRAMGQEAYVIDASAADAETLFARLRALEAARERIAAELRERNARDRAALETLWDAVAPLAVRSGARRGSR